LPAAVGASRTRKKLSCFYVVLPQWCSLCTGTNISVQPMRLNPPTPFLPTPFPCSRRLRVWSFRASTHLCHSVSRVQFLGPWGPSREIRRGLLVCRFSACCAAVLASASNEGWIADSVEFLVPLCVSSCPKQGALDHVPSRRKCLSTRTSAIPYRQAA